LGSCTAAAAPMKRVVTVAGSGGVDVIGVVRVVRGACVGVAGAGGAFVGGAVAAVGRSMRVGAGRVCGSRRWL